MSIKAKVAAALSLNMMLWLAMLLAFSGILFCAAGLYFVLVPRLGPADSAFIVGGSLVGVVVLLGLIVALSMKSPKPRKIEQPHRGPDNFIEQQIRPVLGDRATDWAKQNSGIAVVGALSAGVLLAASPRLRSLIYGAAAPIVTRKTMQAMHRFTDDG